MVQERWNLRKQVAKAKSVDAKQKVQAIVEAHMREASTIRTIRLPTLVHAKGTPCSPKDACRLVFEEIKSKDTHYFSECESLLKSLGVETPKKAQKRTLSDYFGKPLPSSKEANQAKVNQPSQAQESTTNVSSLVPFWEDIQSPKIDLLQHEQTIIEFVKKISEQEKITATRALSCILNSVGGSSFAKEDISIHPSHLPHVPSSVATAIEKLSTGVYPITSKITTLDVCRPVNIKGALTPVPGLGDCGIFAFMAVASKSFNPPPLSPNAPEVVRALHHMGSFARPLP